MALEFFASFVMRQAWLIRKVENIKGAKRAIDRGTPVVWDVLMRSFRTVSFFSTAHLPFTVLFIQAFEPVLYRG